MAIDDNTSYELTGAQVKDLASKIKAKADSSSLATVATTGNYNDLTNQPTIPTVNDATLTIQQNGTSVGTFTANASSNATISLTDTTYSTMTGATSGAAGTSGLVPAPAAGDQAKYLKGDGTWGTYDDPMIDEAACAIKPMSNAFAQTLADNYNDAHADPQDPSSYISALDVTDAIPFMFVNQSGEPISTLSGVRNALRTSNRVVYNGTDDKFVSGHNRASGYATFGLFDPSYSEVKNYKVRAGNSSDTPAFKQYLPYIIVLDEYGMQDAWGYTDGTESADSLTDVPETKYQIAHDANGNLYMASDATSAGDWKQISNVAVPTVNDGTLTIQHNGTNVQTFTANQSTNATANIETIYADTISPATAVDPITASMIAGGASPETLANGSVVEIVGTTTGDNQNYCIKYADGRLIAIIRKAFSNASFSAWGSCYGHEFGAGWLGNYAVAFTYKPVVNCYATSSAALWVCVDAGNDNESLTAAPTVGLVRPSTNAAVSGAMHLVAYGFWK